MAKPLVSVIMGSQSDWDTMRHAAETLEALGVPHDVRILSAHRTPEALDEHILSSDEQGVEVFIAAAGGAAHLAGVIAAKTLRPVLGVPMDATVMNGTDALLSIVQMPGGVPVGTLAVGKPGAVNAALLAGLDPTGQQSPGARIGVMLAQRRVIPNDAEKYLPALMRDSDPSVRRAAAQWIGALRSLQELLLRSNLLN